MINQIESALLHIRQRKPLILCLTNYVTMDLMANSLLAAGCAPIMSVDARELEELLIISQVVSINIGTLDEHFIERCHQAAALAQRHNKPLVLDPVGAGASTLRTQTARDLMPYADIIRGNASEIMALLDNSTQTQGVESTQSVADATSAALQLAKSLDCSVVVSGADDFICDPTRQDLLSFGSALMPMVTGMGCTLTSMIAAFRAVLPDSFEAARLATAWFGLCGQLSQRLADKPGSFRSAFIDQLYAADFAAMRTLI